MSQTKCKDYLVLHVNKNCRLSNYRHRNLKIPKNLKKKFLHRGVQIIKGLNVPAFGSKGEFNIRSRVPFCLIPLNLSLSLFKTKKLEDITVSEQCRFFSWWMSSKAKFCNCYMYTVGWLHWTWPDSYSINNKHLLLITLLNE